MTKSLATAYVTSVDANSLVGLSNLQLVIMTHFDEIPLSKKEELGISNSSPFSSVTFHSLKH